MIASYSMTYLNCTNLFQASIPGGPDFSKRGGEKKNSTVVVLGRVMRLIPDSIHTE